MNKLAIFVTLLGVSGLATARLLDFSADRWAGDEPTGRSERQVHEQWVRYQVFKQTLKDTVDELGNGQIGVKQAHLRVLAIAREYCPEYLRHLRRWEDGETDDERIVHNLVGHVREECANPMLERLQEQVCEYLEELRTKK